MGGPYTFLDPFELLHHFKTIKPNLKEDIITLLLMVRLSFGYISLNFKKKKGHQRIIHTLTPWLEYAINLLIGNAV